MAERTPLKNLDAPVSQSSSPLDSLKASRDLGTKPANVDASAAAATDLSKASIPLSGVQRASPTAGKRILRPPAPAKAVASKPETRVQPRKPSAAKRPAETYGILKNPCFPYEGDLVDRFVTLVANMCKALEQMVLRLLGGGDAPSIETAPVTQLPTEPDQETEQEREERERREKLQRDLAIHRS